MVDEGVRCGSRRARIFISMALSSSFTPGAKFVSHEVSDTVTSGEISSIIDT